MKKLILNYINFVRIGFFNIKKIKSRIYILKKFKTREKHCLNTNEIK